jgi:hypothetical protein
MKPQVVVNHTCVLGEGPVWDTEMWDTEMNRILLGEV